MFVFGATRNAPNGCWMKRRIGTPVAREGLHSYLPSYPDGEPQCHACMRGRSTRQLLREEPSAPIDVCLLGGEGGTLPNLLLREEPSVPIDVCPYDEEPSAPIDVCLHDEGNACMMRARALADCCVLPVACAGTCVLRA